jgi:DNA polymerase-3 subunit alpha (Gram-positive type)
MLHLIFDTETTGLPKHPRAKSSVQPRIIEWGGVLVDGKARVVDQLNIIINPGVPLEAIITKITGLADEDLRDEPPFAAVADQLRPFFAQADVMIAHNLPFDSRLMELDLERAGITDWPWPRGRVCTVQEHAEEFGYRPKLTELYEHYTGDKLDQKHRAIDDVRALAEVCRLAGVLR